MELGKFIAILLQVMLNKLCWSDDVLVQDVCICMNYFILLQVPGRGFVNTWVGVFKNIKSIRPGDAAVGFACIGILLFLRVSKRMYQLHFLI